MTARSAGTTGTPDQDASDSTGEVRLRSQAGFVTLDGRYNGNVCLVYPDLQDVLRFSKNHEPGYPLSAIPSVFHPALPRDRAGRRGAGARGSGAKGRPADHDCGREVARAG